MTTHQEDANTKNTEIVVVPRWKDEFDLSDFFANASPRRFPLCDVSEQVPAEELFRTVQGLIVRWVAVYRAAILTENRRLDVFARVVLCLQQMDQVSGEAYHQWFRSASTNFETYSPRDWFIHAQRQELASLLDIELTRVVSGTIASADAPIESEVQNTSSLGDDVPEKITQVARAHDAGQSFLSWLSTKPSLEKEFDPAPWIEKWSPERQGVAPGASSILANEILDAVKREFYGWMTTYQVAMQAAQVQKGILLKVIRCVGVLQSQGIEKYLDWYSAISPEFGGFSPKLFFLHGGFTDLAMLLGGMNRGKFVDWT
jgi:hypothetical protein